MPSIVLAGKSKSIPWGGIKFSHYRLVREAISSKLFCYPYVYPEKENPCKNFCLRFFSA